MENIINFEDYLNNVHSLVSANPEQVDDDLANELIANYLDLPESEQIAWSQAVVNLFLETNLSLFIHAISNNAINVGSALNTSAESALLDLCHAFIDYTEQMFENYSVEESGAVPALAAPDYIEALSHMLAYSQTWLAPIAVKMINDSVEIMGEDEPVPPAFLDNVAAALGFYTNPHTIAEATNKDSSDGQFQSSLMELAKGIVCDQSAESTDFLKRYPAFGDAFEAWAKSPIQSIRNDAGLALDMWREAGSWPLAGIAVVEEDMVEDTEVPSDSNAPVETAETVIDSDEPEPSHAVLPRTDALKRAKRNFH